MRWIGFAVLVVLVGVGVSRGADAHPDNNSDCAGCHSETAPMDAPKVIPAAPGFLARVLQGKQSFAGHASVACVGGVDAEGKVTGCHDISKGLENFLTMELSTQPTDLLCGACHAGAREFGLHHPSYMMDKNGDGVGDTYVRPVQGQDVYTTYAPANLAEPLKSYPDGMVFELDEAGQRRLVSAVPLETVVENDVTTANVVTCTSCHNPHYGFLVELQTQEQVEADLVGRPEGDALLRFRDYDNTLCLTCH